MSKHPNYLTSNNQVGVVWLSSMAEAEENPFLLLFSSPEDARRAEGSREREAHELNRTLIRVLLINGQGEQEVVK